VDLPQPWSPARSFARIRLFGSTLSNELRYNLYYKRATQQKFVLQLPELLSTRLTLGYNLGNEPQYNDESGNLDFNLTRERWTSLSTQIVPNFLLTSWLGRRSKDIPAGTDINEYQTVFGADYISPSQCWTLSFVRQKEYTKQEVEAEYVLKLSVIFLAQQRGYDISPGLVRELPSRRNE
jgi:hypothetical protein